MKIEVLAEDVCFEISKIIHLTEKNIIFDEKDRNSFLFYLPKDIFGREHETEKVNGNFVIKDTRYMIPPFFVRAVSD